EELLADEVPADPPARAHQDKLAEPPGARPRPRARGAAPGDDGERPEQPDPYGHLPIVAHVSRAFPAPRTGGDTAGTAPSYCCGRALRKGPSRCTRGTRFTRPSGPSPLANNARSTWPTPGWSRRSAGPAGPPSGSAGPPSGSAGPPSGSAAGWPGRCVPGARPGGRRRDARPPAPKPPSKGCRGVNERGVLPNRCGRTPQPLNSRGRGTVAGLGWRG